MIVVRRLERPVEFEAADGLAVDTLIALMGGRHDLKWLRTALLRLNRLGKDTSLAQRLREATTRSEAVAAIKALGLDTQDAQTGGAHSAKTGVVRSPQRPLSRIHVLQ
ncbi:PTS sugar transporter subunit IIA [Nitratireductor aquibiodomus]|uniref:PTS sugar transporter subunit IIA n=1 Tax=Nitratireductor aquibiodomus TaxID=204799 RepID=UPI000B7C8A46